MWEISESYKNFRYDTLSLRRLCNVQVKLEFRKRNGIGKTYEREK